MKPTHECVYVKRQNEGFQCKQQQPAGGLTPLFHVVVTSAWCVQRRCKDTLSSRQIVCQADPYKGKVN